MRPKDEPIAQKGPPPIPILRPTVSPPLIFDENYPLTRENSPPILRAVRSNVLSIIHQVISATTPAYTKYYGYFFAMKFNLDICTTLSIIDIK